MATYGWLERNDTRAIVDALLSSEAERLAGGSTPETNRATARKPTPHIFALGESMGAGIALESAAVDPRIEAVVAEASFASLPEAAEDYAGLQKYPLLGKTLFAPGAWMMIERGESIARFPASEVSPEKAVAARAFPVLLICDGADSTLPCRHSEKIYVAASGPRQLWKVPQAFHTGAMAYEPQEFTRRVLQFLETYSVVPN